MEKQSKKLKICTFSKLTRKKLQEIKRFVAQCARQEGYEARFYWESIESRRNRGANEILCYNAEQELVGYLALYHFEEHEVELTLLVHPDYRNTAFYNLLWERAKKAISHYPIDVDQYVFTCNQKFLSLRNYLKKLGAQCRETTYQLCVTKKTFSPVVSANLPQVSLRSATQEDIDSLVSMETDSFSVIEQSYASYIIEALRHPKNAIWIVESEGKPIGKIHLQIKGKSVYFSDFSIIPDKQNLGFGTAALKQTLERCFDELGMRKLFVDVTNEYDLAWYQKFGFQCHESFEHWKVSAYVSPFKERERQLESLLLNFQCDQVQDQLSMSLYKH